MKHSVLIQRQPDDKLHVYVDDSHLPVVVSTDDKKNVYAGLATYLSGDGHQVTIEATYLPTAWKVGDTQLTLLYQVVRTYGLGALDDPNTAEIFYVEIFIDPDGKIGAYYKPYNPEVNPKHIMVKLAPGKYLYMTELSVYEQVENLRRFYESVFDFIMQERQKAISQT